MEGPRLKLKKLESAGAFLKSINETYSRELLAWKVIKSRSTGLQVGI